MSRPTTLRDVADRAGVHPATASRALNADLPGRVTPETAKRVREAARDLGYTPDPTARSLRTRRSGFVGVIVPDLTNPVMPPIVRGIEEVMWGAGVACLLADTDNDPDREGAVIAELRARRCEGLIVATATRQSPAIAQLAQQDLPTILVNRAVDDLNVPLVAADDGAGVEAAVRHLVDLGHERLANITGPTTLSTTVTRSAAFEAAVASAGIAAPAPVVHGRAFTIAEGERVTAGLLRDHPEVTAIVAGNDMLAIGAYEALAAAGLRCPEDVSVTGHNNMPLVDKIDPPLTTVAIPQNRIGVEAAKLLLARIRGEGEQRPDDVLLPTELIVRASTAPPRRQV